MKRFSIIFGLISTITATIVMVTLLVMALIHTNKYNPIDSIVFIESISNESTKDGMGFVYKVENNKNYIVTSYHVVEGSNSLYVENIEHNKRSADLLWFDAYTDIAVLEISDEFDLTAVRPNKNTVNVSDSIYYYNLKNNSLEKGNVLSLDNEINVNANYGNSFYIANSINANIDNGNSGSPVFNVDNELVGMICLKEEESSNAFYLTYDYIKDVVSKLENQELVRANLGATMVNTTNIDLLNQYGIFPGEITGVVILDVKEGYPLNLSGLVNGDIITKINDTVISDVNILQSTIYSHNINDVVSIEYARNGAYNRVDVILK